MYAYWPSVVTRRVSAHLDAKKGEPLKGEMPILYTFICTYMYMMCIPIPIPY